MADSITGFDLYRQTTPFTTQPPTVEGTLIQQLPGSARSATDGTLPSPDYFYRLIGHTASGLIIPYNDVAAHGQAGTPGGTLFATATTGRSGDQSHVQTVAVAPDGSVYTGGYMQGVINFGSTQATNTSASICCFVAKWTNTGTLIWVKTFNGGGYRGAVYSVSVAPSGQVVISGGFSSGTIDFGGGFSLNTPTNTVRSFVASLDPTTGIATMAKQFPASDSFGEAATGTSGTFSCVDSAGNILFTTNYSGSLDFGNGVTITGGRAFIAKISSAGVAAWAKSFGVSGLTPTGICLNRFANDGSCYICGTSVGNLNFGNGIAFNNTGDRDGYLVMYSSAGNAIFGRPFGSPSGGQIQAINCVSQDLDGNVLACGTYQGKIDVGGPNIWETVGASGIWMAKYTQTLAYINSLGTPSAVTGNGDSSFAVITDSNRNIYLTGHNVNSMDWGNNVWSFGNGDGNVFVTKFNANFLAQWTRRYITVQVNNDGLAAALSPSGAVWFGGYFGGQIDFGNGFTFTSSPDFSEAGFLLKLNP